MKIDRMLGELTVLMESKKVKARELAERFEVSVRTVYRDIENICMAGIPIVTFPGGGGGIGIAEGFTLDKNVLTSEEMKSIVLGLKSLGSVMAGSHISTLLAKLPRDNQRFIRKDDIVIDLASHYREELIPKISLLRQAIANKVTVTFDYYSNKGRTERELEPYFIAFRWTAWYVFGYCRMRKDFRLFKLTRIVGLKLTASCFEAREVSEQEADLDAFFADAMTKRYASLLVDRSLEFVLVDEYGPGSYEAIDENTLLARWDYVDETKMVRTILSLGSGVKVTEPQELVDAVKAEAQRILGKYT